MSDVAGTSAPVVLEDLQDVVRDYDLAEVRIYEHSGRRIHDDGDLSQPHGDPEQEMTARARQDPGVFEGRFHMNYSDGNIELSSDVGVLFASDLDAVLSEETLNEFMSQVAVMAAFPYLREGLATSAARLGVTRIPTIGLIRRGEIALTREPDED